MSYTGSCLCGDIRFQIGKFAPQAANCFCSMCRKFHGAPFAAIAGVDRADFVWIQGEDRLERYEADNGTVRSFCPRCGSSLLFASPRASQDVIEVALGAMDGDIDIRPSANIFVGSKANWCQPQTGLPSYEAGRSSALIDANGKSNLDTTD